MTTFSRAHAAVALALIACSPPSSADVPAPTTPTTPVTPTPTEPAPLPSETPPPVVAPTPSDPPSTLPPTPPPTAALPVAPIALADTGLPAVTTGPAIRLEPLPITTRDVNGRHVPSITLASPTTQAAVDAWFEDHTWCHGPVQLAIEGFVSYPCTYSEPAASGGLARLGMNMRFTEAGETLEAHAADVFLPGTEVDRMVRVWADDPSPRVGEMCFGPRGAIVVSPDDSEDDVHLPWRTIAPYIRADGPLGPALVAAGLTLAPVGTTAPVTPIATTVLDFDYPETAMETAARLTPGTRAGARLRVGSETASLILTSGDVEREIPGQGRRRQGYLYGPVAELVPVRIEHAVEIHETAGPRTPVVGALPPGAAAVAARGPIGSRVSELGTGWVLIATPGGAGGYVQGREVLEPDPCGDPAGSERMIGGYVTLAPDVRFAWTLQPGARSVVTLFPIDATCAIGAQARRATVDGEVTDLRLVRSTTDSDEWLLVLVTAASFDSPARTISVFGATADAPALYRASFDAPALRLAERHGPGRAAGYFPVMITSGASQTWLSWNGETFEAQTE